MEINRENIIHYLTSELDFYLDQRDRAMEDQSLNASDHFAVVRMLNDKISMIHDMALDLDIETEVLSYD